MKSWTCEHTGQNHSHFQTHCRWDHMWLTTWLSSATQVHTCTHSHSHPHTHAFMHTRAHPIPNLSDSENTTTESPAAAEGNCVRGRHGSWREGVLLLRAHANSRGPVPSWSLVRGRRPAPPASEKVSSCQTRRALVRGELNSHQICWIKSSKFFSLAEIWFLSLISLCLYTFFNVPNDSKTPWHSN